MEKLPLEIKKNHYDYKLISRNDKAAIYGQYLPGGELLIAYEVFQIREQQASTSVINGQIINYIEKELFPSDEEFGKTAWSFNNLENAEKCFNGLSK